MAYDPYADKVVALLHFDGADGSTDFIDEIGNVWTPTGTTQISTQQAKFGTSSGRFYGDWLYTAAAPFDFGDQDFCIECFAWLNDLSVPAPGNQNPGVAFASMRGSSATNGWRFYGSGDGKFQFHDLQNGLTVQSTQSLIASHTWHHFAITRAGSIFRLFLNGIQVASGTQAAALAFSNSPLTLGSTWGTDSHEVGLDGYLDEVRITKGAARYTADFEPPSEPFVLDLAPPTVPPAQIIAGTSSLSGLVTLSANPSDDTGIASVQFELDGQPFGPLLEAPPWQVNWDTTQYADGGHIVTVVATDSAGNQTTSDPTQYNVKNNFAAPATLPTVAVSAPANGAIVVDTIAVTAAASDAEGIIGVQFKIDDSLLGAQILVPPFTVDFDTTTVSDGTHVIKAIATDTDGNTVTDAITIVVSNEQPERAPVSIEVRRYRENLRAHLPPGDALNDEGQGQLTNLLDGLAYEFSRIDQRGADLIEEADPRTTTELLADWERLTGLPDACTPAEQTLDQRRGAVVARLTSQSTPTRTFLIQQAATLGYTVTVAERHARRYRDPVGGRYGNDAWQFVWEVHITGAAAAPELECVLNRYAPAHTIVHFIYE